MKRRQSTGAYWFWMIALLGLAIYQIVLIFGESPAKQENDEWYSMATPDEDANILRPTEMYITLGGEEGSYGRLKSYEEEFEAVFCPAYALFQNVIQEGEYSGGWLKDLPWQEEACVLTYHFAMESFVILQQLGMEEESFPEGAWSEIWIMPAQKSQEKAKVYLLDREAGQYLKAESSCWKQKENQQFLKVLQEQGTLLKRSYLAINRAWPEQKLDSGFLLEQSLRETVYEVRVQSPFMMGKKLSLAQAELYARRFAEYPDAATVKKSTKQVLLNNEKITVKIDESGHLQYVETLTDEEKAAVSIREAYQLAVGFLNADTSWGRHSKLSYELSGYEREENGYTFYFTYCINGVPYRQESKNAEAVYPIRITVEGSKVRRYERDVMEFKLEADSDRPLTDTWQTAMDDMAKRDWKLLSIPELRYYREKSRMVLYWEARTKDGTVRLPAK